MSASLTSSRGHLGLACGSPRNESHARLCYGFNVRTVKLMGHRTAGSAINTFSVDLRVLRASHIYDTTKSASSPNDALLYVVGREQVNAETP